VASFAVSAFVMRVIFVKITVCYQRKKCLDNTDCGIHELLME